MNFLVLGGGAQGSAAAFDLLRQDDVERVVVADLSVDRVHPCLEPHLGGRLELRKLDAAVDDEVRTAMHGTTGVLCALPYRLNFDMARLAVEAGVHFADLGGNTEIVGRQRSLHDLALERELSVVPDTGLAPGMVNILAEDGIRRMDSVDSVRIWVGGLPQNPKPPLNYQIVYSLEGVLDYYVTPAVVLRDGKVTTVEALSGLETVRFGDADVADATDGADGPDNGARRGPGFSAGPAGELEAFFTGGGISTMPYRYEGRIPVMEYKTLRYPGHARIMSAMRDLGLMADQEVELGEARISPRQFLIRLATPVLENPKGDDMVVARVRVAGRRKGVAQAVVYDVLDFFDRDTKLTAMARTTGFSLAVTALMQARRQVGAWGVGTPDETMPPATYLEALRRRNIQVSITEEPGNS